MKRDIDWNYVAGIAFCGLALVLVTIAWLAGKLGEEKALFLFGGFGLRTVYMLRGFRAPALPGGGAAGGGSEPEKPSATPGQAAQRIAHVVVGGLLLGLLGIHHGRES